MAHFPNTNSLAKNNTHKKIEKSNTPMSVCVLQYSRRGGSTYYHGSSRIGIPTNAPHDVIFFRLCFVFLCLFSFLFSWSTLFFRSSTAIHTSHHTSTTQQSTCTHFMQQNLPIVVPRGQPLPIRWDLKKRWNQKDETIVVNNAQCTQ